MEVDEAAKETEKQHEGFSTIERLGEVTCEREHDDSESLA